MRLGDTVMCCLCFGSFEIRTLSMTPEFHLTDVCMDCRAAEIAACLRSDHMYEDGGNGSG